MNSPQALVSFDWQVAPANTNKEEAPQQPILLEGELQAMELVVSAAVLVVTAFRLRDEASLIDTLRLLAQAVTAFEERPAYAEA